MIHALGTESRNGDDRRVRIFFTGSQELIGIIGSVFDGRLVKSIKIFILALFHPANGPKSFIHVDQVIIIADAIARKSLQQVYCGGKVVVFRTHTPGTGTAKSPVYGGMPKNVHLSVHLSAQRKRIVFVFYEYRAFLHDLL